MEHETVQLIAWSGDKLAPLLRAAADWLEAQGRSVILADLVRSRLRDDDEEVTIYYYPA